MKRMKHPLHGFHHAYNSHEETAMRAGGWVDDVPENHPDTSIDDFKCEDQIIPRRRGPNKLKV